MEISDIQIKDDKVEITFSNEYTGEDCMIILVAKKDIQDIKAFAMQNLS